MDGKINNRFAPYKIPNKARKDDLDDITDKLKKTVVSEKRVFKRPTVRKTDELDSVIQSFNKVSLNNKEKELEDFAKQIINLSSNKK